MRRMRLYLHQSIRYCDIHSVLPICRRELDIFKEAKVYLWYHSVSVKITQKIVSGFVLFWVNASSISFVFTHIKCVCPHVVTAEATFPEIHMCYIPLRRPSLYLKRHHDAALNPQCSKNGIKY